MDPARDAAAKQFPQVLARGEIMRRYAMSGVAAVKNLSEPLDNAVRYLYTMNFAECK